MKTYKFNLPHPLAPLRRNQRGVALLMAIVTLSLLIFLAVDVQYDTTVDYIVAKQQVDRIRAYYAAKSGMELSLLRIMLYKQAVAAMGSAGAAAGASASMLDPIWQFPFMWPPSMAAAASPVKMTEVDKDQLKEVTEKSLMTANYTASISPEGGRIDINDLGSSIKGFKKLMNEQVMRIFKSELEQNESFRRKYNGFNFQELVNNISDYIDEDSDGQNGGDESGPYRDLSDKDIKMPPNRALRTIDELHQVAGVTEDFYQLLASRVTIYGTKGINVNYASNEILMSLDPSMTKVAVDKVVERRSNPKIGGPFKDDKDFFGFVGGNGVNTKAMQDAKMPLLYDQEFNFRVKATGLSGNVKHEITAITYDLPNLTQRFEDLLNKQDQSTGGTAAGAITAANGSATAANGTSSAGGGKKSVVTAKGRPTVVYWEEN